VQRCTIYGGALTGVQEMGKGVGNALLMLSNAKIKGLKHEVETDIVVIALK
jgi:hypothetical protein